jgi:hypothetical protein
LALLVAIPGESLGQGGGGGGPAPKGDITAVNTGAGSGLSGGALTGDANLSLLTTCTEGQVLKRIAGAWVCAADDNTSSGGTVTSIAAGTGLSASPASPITSSGTISVANGGIGSDQLAASAVTSAKISDETIVNGDIAPGAGISPSKIAGTAAILGANAFTASQSIAGSLSLTGSITLPDTSGATTGVLNIGEAGGIGIPFLHGFGGFSSTFVGRGAGNFNMLSPVQGGSFNTGVGTGVLHNTASGFANVGVGFEALVTNSTGAHNTALGTQALLSNATGNDNTAVGFNALGNNQNGDTFDRIGHNNTAVGSLALFHNINGSNNIAIGAGAGLTGPAGSSGGSNGNSNIYIGGPAPALEDFTIRLGNGQSRTFVAGINGVTTGGTAVQVVIDGNGQLGTISSSRRFKYDIQNMNTVTDKLLQLRPVTFRYQQAQNDGTHPLQYGLIAEEVADVYPDLVQRSADGEPSTVLYHTLPSMLLNEFQKQHRMIESLKEQLAQIQSELAALKSKRD